MAGKRVLSRVTITIEDVDVVVERKAVKNINLAVYPPDGRIRVSVPYQLPEDQVIDVLQSRIAWLKKKQQRYLTAPVVQKAEPESITDAYLFGDSFIIEQITGTGKNGYAINEPGEIILYLKDDNSIEMCKAIIYEWYRAELKKRIPEMIKKWEPIIGVNVLDWRIRKMKTRWGTCNITKKRVWLSLELARFPLECLEYVVVHEMVHLLERYHNARFKSFMDTFLPDWRTTRKLLNDLNITV